MQAETPTNMLGLVSLMIQAIGLVVLIGAAWSLSAKLTTLFVKLEALVSVPTTLTSHELRIAKTESDVNQCWSYARELRAQVEKDKEQEIERLERFFRRWDAKGHPHE